MLTSDFVNISSTLKNKVKAIKQYKNMIDGPNKIQTLKILT